MITPADLQRARGGGRRPMVDRSSDRIVTLAGIALAVLFLVAAAASTVLPEATRRGAWLPLHLALAGGAGTAIAAVMPFFVAAFAAARPVAAAVRLAAIVGVAGGGLLVAAGVVLSQTGAAVAGGLVFIAGIALAAVATVLPLRGAMGPSRGVVTAAYVVALIHVALGAALATLFLAGFEPLVTGWVAGRAAHGWLNMFGFVSLVVAATMLHFFPTVIAARIAAGWSARVTIYGLSAGPPTVAVAMLIGSDVMAVIGAVLTVVGAAALAAYAGRVWGRRAAWTTDAGWHTFVMGGMIAAIAWFLCGSVLAAGRVLVHGARPEAWSFIELAAPLVVGWAGIAIVASASHLLPAVGPGDQAAHAAQRRVLGTGAVLRLGLLNVGTAAAAIGLPAAVPVLAAVGLLAIGVGLGWTALLVGRAVFLGVRRQ